MGRASAFVWFEISLDSAEGRPRVHVRLALPGSSSTREARSAAAIDHDLLRGRVHDPAGYGEALRDMIFADPEIRMIYAEGKTYARQLGVPFRIQLNLQPEAADLLYIGWERLIDPDGTPVSVGPEMFFARYVPPHNVRPDRPRPVRPFRVLIAVADPSDIEEYGLQHIERAEQERQIVEALGTIHYRILSRTHRVGKSAILRELARGLGKGYDVLYLLCHGRSGESPALWLEDDAGNADEVISADLASEIAALLEPPRLVIIASCESAGSSEAPSLSPALGPSLAANGVPTVLAMSGAAGVGMLSKFMPAVINGLKNTGKPDVAVGLARRELYPTDQSWSVPVLYTSVQPDRMGWAYPPAAMAGEFTKWPAVVQSIRDAKLIPIVGPLASEHLVGNRGEITREISARAGFPMQSYLAEDLSRVGRFVASHLGREYLLDQISQEFRRGVMRNALQGVRLEAAQTEEIEELVAELAQKCRANSPIDPFRVLAELRLPIYITTDPFPVLAHALREAGVDPVVEFFRWKDRPDFPQPVWKADTDYTPSRERPLVLHLLGLWRHPASLVLSDDDLLEFVLEFGPLDAMPGIVKGPISRSALLFLGFGIEEFDFRVIFKTIKKRWWSIPGDHVNVAVQVELGEGLENRDLAQQYLESYYDRADVTMLWGTVDEFARSLKVAMEEVP